MKQCSRCGSDHSPGSPDCPAQRIDTLVGGRYLLESLIGIGGFGAVYRAVHVELGRAFALKLLVPPTSRQPGVAERFVREARVAASLEHPGIVGVTDFGTSEEGDPYLVMELLRGSTVQAHLQRFGGQLPPEETVTIAREALVALAAAHAHKVIHRDLKPENLFLSQIGSTVCLKILDFGLAKALDHATELTRSGEFLGTVAFASPEQLLDFRSVDARTDVYSLGATLYFLLTGATPAAGSSITEVIARIVRGEVERHPRKLAPATPQWLDHLIARALARDPSERFADGGDMLRELDRLATSTSDDGSFAPTVLSSAANSSATPERMTLANRGAGSLAAMENSKSRPRLRSFAIRILASALVIALATWLGMQGREGERREDDANPVPSSSHRVRLAAAELTIGSDAPEVDRAMDWCLELAGEHCRRELYAREEPPHAVRLAAFEIDREEVTNRALAEWLAETELVTISGTSVWLSGEPIADLHPEWSGLAQVDGRLVARAGREDLPVVQVTWFGAAQYCRSRGGRLPTEAEWERAARGLERRDFPWGNERPDCSRAVFGRSANGPCSAAGSGPVRADVAFGDRSPEGVHHLGGNVSEWVADSFVAPYPDCSSTPCENPLVEGNASRVVRGGNWEGLAEMTRAAGRGRRAPDQPSTQIGFRCAADLEEDSE